MKPSEFITAMDEHFVSQGWTQGSSFKRHDDGRVSCCLISCKNTLRDKLRVGQRVTAGVQAYIERAADLRFPQNLESWNDRPGRTLDEVRQMLSRARDLAKADEEARGSSW